MVHLTNGQFLNELVKLFQQSKDKGTVLVTMKRSALTSSRQRTCFLTRALPSKPQASQRP